MPLTCNYLILCKKFCEFSFLRVMYLCSCALLLWTHVTTWGCLYIYTNPGSVVTDAHGYNTDVCSGESCSGPVFTLYLLSHLLSPYWRIFYGFQLKYEIVQRIWDRQKALGSIETWEENTHCVGNPFCSLFSLIDLWNLWKVCSHWSPLLSAENQKMLLCKCHVYGLVWEMSPWFWSWFSLLFLSERTGRPLTKPQWTQAAQWVAFCFLSSCLFSFALSTQFDISPWRLHRHPDLLLPFMAFTFHIH